MPADNSKAADAAQREGFVTRYNYVGTGPGMVIRIIEFAPGAPKFMHRTKTVDYALLLSGIRPLSATLLGGRAGNVLKMEVRVHPNVRPCCEDGILGLEVEVCGLVAP
jgi:hypothetical protein